jgi:hypothetical protein
MTRAPSIRELESAARRGARLAADRPAPWHGERSLGAVSLVKFWPLPSRSLEQVLVLVTQEDEGDRLRPIALVTR